MVNMAVGATAFRMFEHVLSPNEQELKFAYERRRVQNDTESVLQALDEDAAYNASHGLEETLPSPSSEARE